MLDLDQREIAAVLAGLRSLQAVMAERVPEGVLEIACDDGNVEPLDADEIDELCEKINLGGQS